MTGRQHSNYPAAKDLSREEPAPMDAKLTAYPWLPRMIDKARASQAGTLGDYYRYPCPIDAACLDLLGIDAGAFREIADQAGDDKAVIEALATIDDALQRLRHFNPVRLNAELHSTES
jgi:hypothetical protein